MKVSEDNATVQVTECVVDPTTLPPVELPPNEDVFILDGEENLPLPSSVVEPLFDEVTTV